MKQLIRKTSIVILMLTLAMSLSAKSKKTIIKKIKKNVQLVEQVQLPSSIVVLSSETADILNSIGAGDQIAAVLEIDEETFDPEEFLSYNPDLVFLTDDHNFLIETLDSYGIKYYITKQASVIDTEKEIMDIGELTGHLDEAALVVAQMVEDMNAEAPEAPVEAAEENDTVEAEEPAASEEEPLDL